MGVLLKNVEVTGIRDIYSIYIIYLYLYYIPCHLSHLIFLLNQLVYIVSFYFPPPLFTFYLFTHTHSTPITRFCGDRGDIALKYMKSLINSRHLDVVTSKICCDTLVTERKEDHD